VEISSKNENRNTLVAKVFNNVKSQNVDDSVSSGISGMHKSDVLTSLTSLSNVSQTRENITDSLANKLNHCKYRFLSVTTKVGTFLVPIENSIDCTFNDYLNTSNKLPVNENSVASLNTCASSSSSSTVRKSPRSVDKRCGLSPAKSTVCSNYSNCSETLNANSVTSNLSSSVSEREEVVRHSHKERISRLKAKMQHQEQQLEAVRRKRKRDP